MLKRLYFLFSLLFIQLTLFCQDDVKKIINYKSAGVLVEYGQPFYYLPEGTRYYVAIVGGNFHFPLYKTKNKFNLSLDLFPNYGFVILAGGENQYEFGLNVRLGFNLLLKPENMLSLKLASGPHYITADSDRQVNGFIFSDYFLFTYSLALPTSEQLFLLEFEIGYRHLSNAGIEEPNYGISNIVVGIGFYKTF